MPTAAQAAGLELAGVTSSVLAEVQAKAAAANREQVAAPSVAEWVAEIPVVERAVEPGVASQMAESAKAAAPHR